MAAAAEPTRAAAIRWLESHANSDGSFGAGLARPATTAEVVVALAAAGRCSAPVVRRAIDWLRHSGTVAVDFRARALRAEASCGVSSSSAADALHALIVPAASQQAPRGWGTVSASGVTSFDTALAIGGLVAAARPVTTFEIQLGELLTRRATIGAGATATSAWSADRLGGNSVATLGEPTVTSEIVRALSPLASTPVTVTVDTTDVGNDAAHYHPFRTVLFCKRLPAP